jgi:hypothetical protein
LPSKIKANVRVGVFETAKTVHRLFRAHHVRRILRIASELQRKICLASRVKLGRSTRINVPAAVGQLPCAHVIGELGYALRVGFTQYVQIINVVGFESRVGFELANPVPGLHLQRQQVIRATLDGLLEALKPFLQSRSECSRR